MISFLVDENVEFSVVVFLRKKGYDVLSIAETSPSVDDITVLKAATKEKKILVTSDKDFGNLIFRYRQPALGVILFRMEDQSARRKIEVLSILLKNHQDQLSGNFITVSDSKIRIRKLDNI